jgi:hypothetical protein
LQSNLFFEKCSFTIDFGGWRSAFCTTWPLAYHHQQPPLARRYDGETSAHRLAAIVRIIHHHYDCIPRRRLLLSKMDESPCLFV